MIVRRPYDQVLATSVDRINKAFNIILPLEFQDGVYHIKERVDGGITYLSIQNNESYFRIDCIPESINIL